MSPKVVLALGLLGVAVLFSSCFTVQETEQVVITQFGEPVRTVTNAGLHFKLPFLQDVRSFEKRVLEWDSGDESHLTTREERFILVDTTARWRIRDARLFLTSLTSETNARSRIDDIIDGATRAVISSHNLIDAVRSSNRAFEDSQTLAQIDDSGEPAKVEQVTIGREKLVEMVLQQAGAQLASFGIELVDFRFRRIEYEDTTRKKVYARMESERHRIAEHYRSEGRGSQAEIDGRKERDLKQIESEAFRKAEIIRGEADAEAARIYAEAYGADSDFYAFTKTLETYKTALASGDTTLVLTTGSELFKYLGPQGK